MKKVWKLSLFCLILYPLTCSALLVTLYGSRNYKLDPKHRHILSVEDYRKWEYGDLVYFFNVDRPFDTRTGIYGEFKPRISFSKVFRREFTMCGLTKDVLLASEINFSGTGFRAYLYGLGFTFDVPYFDVLGLNVYARNNPTLKGATWQVTPVWSYKLELGKLTFWTYGNCDFAGSEGSTYRSNQLYDPRFVIDLGKLFNCKEGAIWGGIRWEYWRHARGGDETENVPQVLLVWKLQN